MTDQMKLCARITGMMHTSPRPESPSTWASFKICLRNRSRRCRRLLKYNSRILSLQSVCEAPRAKKHRCMMFWGLIGHNPPFNRLGLTWASMTHLTSLFTWPRCVTLKRNSVSSNSHYFLFVFKYAAHVFLCRRDVAKSICYSSFFFVAVETFRKVRAGDDDGLILSH